MASVSEQCRGCITIIRSIVSILSSPDRHKARVHHGQVNDELERFSLWIGNIGALHRPENSMSLESRLCDADDVLTYILELLDNLDMAAEELLTIVSGEREGEIASAFHNVIDAEDQNEETELLKEIGTCITRLFRVSSLIQQAAPTDLFAKALSRTRYRFNDQFDIAHVGDKYPKLATEELAWLQKRLGRAITQRRHYLSYVQDHRQKLEGSFAHDKTPELAASNSEAPTKHLSAMTPELESSSQPSTFFTKASSLTPSHITPRLLTAEEESDSEIDARSYTTISRSVDDDLDSSTTVRIPKLDELRTGPKREFECPFCFRMKKFKNERVWRQHVFWDLRTYVCTFPDCDAPYFGDINEWFRHEMQTHRVSYTCRLCQSKKFLSTDRYLAHVRKYHPDMLEDGEQQLVLDIARKPLDQIPAHECPCCSEWVDRLSERAVVASMPSETSNHILTVTPSVFKRHLASHLEQLALFAIPIGSAVESDIDSNAAIKKDVDALSEVLDRSILAFDSPKDKQSSDDVSMTDAVAVAATRDQDDEREDIIHLPDRGSTDVPTREPSPQLSSKWDQNYGSEQEAETMDLDVRSDPIIPTYEGFKTHARQLNPRLPDYMLERVTQEQMRRYKRMLEFKLKHLHAVTLQICASRRLCPDLGGEPQQPPLSKLSDDDDESYLGITLVSALFPVGIPLPPVKRLPALFECPLCFKVKRFDKPSDWTKHVHEDVQPFTCTFPNCHEPKSYKRKADWVRHENERHRQLESWVCSIGDCNHPCYRKDNFVQHLIREHKIAEPRRQAIRGAAKGMLKNTVDDDFWDLVDQCRRGTTKLPKDEPCRFCGNISTSWKKLTVHLAKHMEQISLPILPLIDQKTFPDVLPNSIDDLRTVSSMNDVIKTYDAQDGQIRDGG